MKDVICSVISIFCLNQFDQVDIGSHVVRTKAYVINMDRSYVKAVGNYSVPSDWRPDLSNGLDRALPFPWPSKYVNEYKQPMNYWAFFTNAKALCDAYDETKSPEIVAIMSALYARLVDYTYADGGKRFGLYKFKHSYRKNPNATSVPWTSAYGSGASIVGLTALWQCAGIEDALKTASEFVAGLASPVDPRKPRPQYWVSFVDEDGFLWFEERPLDQVEQPRILNGHIRALTGLYEYFVSTRDDGALQLLRAGIATVEANALRYRVPGKINAYDLLKPHVDDYGPERTIAQQDILHRMTGDEVFASYRDLFDADMRDDIEEKRQKKKKEAL